MIDAGTSSNTVKLAWISSVEDISPEEWNNCFAPGDTANSYGVFRALARGRLPETEFHYLVGRRSGALALVIPCYRYRSALDVLAPEPVRRICNSMRHTFPSFLMMRAFIVGSPLAISSDSLGVTQLSGAQLAQLLPEIKAMILSKANELRSHFAVLKELTAEKIALIRDGLAPEFVFVPSMPGSSIRLADPMKRTFETRLRSKYRSLMQQRKALFQRSGAKWELYENFSPIASEMHSLYENVLDKSKTKFEILTPEFFASLSEQLKQNAIVLLARREGAPLAFGLILFSRCHANLIYVGLDYASRDETASYYNIFYRAIEEAESRGCETISVGQTTYESKAILGATFFNLTLGLAPLTRLSKFLISRFSSALFPVIETPERRVFKNFPRN